MATLAKLLKKKNQKNQKSQKKPIRSKSASAMAERIGMEYAAMTKRLHQIKVETQEEMEAIILDNWVATQTPQPQIKRPRQADSSIHFSSDSLNSQKQEI